MQLQQKKMIYPIILAGQPQFFEERTEEKLEREEMREQMIMSGTAGRGPEILDSLGLL